MLSFILLEYIQFLRRNIFAAFQISILFLTVLLMTSAVGNDWQRYKPLSRIQDRDGLVLSHGLDDTTPEEFSKQLKGVEYVLTCGDTALRETTSQETVATTVYPEEILDTYEPELSAGRWLRSDADEIELVVTANKNGWSVGDTLELFYYDRHGEGHTVSARICGVLKETVVVWGEYYGIMSTPKKDYRDLYSCVRSQEDGICRFFTSEAQVKKAGIPMEYMSKVVIVYENGISNFKKKYNRIKLGIREEDIAEESARVDVIALPLFIGKSWDSLSQTMWRYVPLCACVLFMTLICIMNICAINLNDAMHRNAIYCVLGLTWNRLGNIAVFHMLVTVGMSFMFTGVWVTAIYRLRLRSWLYIEPNVTAFAVMGVVSAVLLIMTAVVSRVTMRRRQPAAVLRDAVQ